jgi:FkbM family methyltransferase
MAGMIMNLHAKLPQLRTFCDVGANYGHFTHEFLARWGGGGAGASRRRGLAIEPLPHNARVLRRRFKSDRRITVVQAAASHADAEPRQLFGTPFGSERGELLSSPSARFNISEFRRRAKGHWHVVNVTTLNSLVRAHGFDTLDLLKIDTGTVPGVHFPRSSVLECRVPLFAPQKALNYPYSAEPPKCSNLQK